MRRWWRSIVRRALTRSAPTEDIAIAGYYQGLSSVQSRGMYTDTKRYVAGIRALAPDALVVSPGPCTPAEAGISGR